MLLRAAFWIGLVTVLAPHEPDLGYGSPGPASGVVSQVSNWAQSRLTGLQSNSPIQDSASVSALDEPARRGRSLAQIKSEIAAAKQAR